MKKFLISLAVMAVAINVSAQKMIVDNTNTSKSEIQKIENENPERRNSGASFDYGFIEDGYILDFNLIFNGFWLSGGMGSQDFDDAGDADMWRVLVGYNYRYWFNDRLYLQGAAGIGYGHTKVKLKGSKDSSSDGGGLLSFTPRLGVRLISDWGIEAGYRWDFSDFKFDKQHTSDYFTVSLVGTF